MTDHETEVDHHAWRAPLAHRQSRPRGAGRAAHRSAVARTPSWPRLDRRDADESVAEARTTGTASSASGSASRASASATRRTQRTTAGQQALDQSRWDRAVARFDRVIEHEGTEGGRGALLEGLRAEQAGPAPRSARDDRRAERRTTRRAATCRTRRRSKSKCDATPGSRCDPENESDEEMKLLVLNGLQNSAPDEAIPMLQKVLQGTSSPKLKARALFVLAQSNSPKAREVLVSIAKGNSNPDLQMKAIQYLGIHGGPESRAALADVYASTSDVDVKRRILSAFMVAGEKDRLLAAAQTRTEPRAAHGSRAPAWRHGRARRTVDALSEGIAAST